MNIFVDNDDYENEKQMADTGMTDEASEAGDCVISLDEQKKKRPAFAYWEVGGEKLKLKLTTDQVLELEKKYRKNLLSMLGDEDNIPPLTTMLQVIHAAAVPWKHGIKLKNIMALYDKYTEQGGTQLNLYVDVYMQIYMVSGFFSNSMVEDLSDSLEKMQETM